jgi:hypothetical protein
MERHFSIGVSTIVALMMAQRPVSSSSGIARDGADEIRFLANVEADRAAEEVTVSDIVGDWLANLARARRASTPDRR